MKRTEKIFGTLVVAGLICGASLAQASSTTPLVSRENYTVGKGDLLTSFAFVPDMYFSDAGDVTRISLKLAGNYFLTDMFAPGVEFGFDHLTGTTDVFRFIPNLRAYWPLQKRFLPYALVGAGYAHGYGQDMFDFAIGFGADCMVSNTVALGIQFRYDLAAGDTTVHEIQFPVGFALYFRL